MTEKELAKTFGMNLKKMRTLHGLSQKQLADALDIERTYLVAMESGKRSTSFAMISNMSKALHCTPSDFFQPKKKQQDAEIIPLNTMAQAHDHLQGMLQKYKQLKRSLLDLNFQEESNTTVRALKNQTINVELIALLPFLSDEAQDFVKKFVEGYLDKTGSDASIRISQNIIEKLKNERMYE